MLRLLPWLLPLACAANPSDGDEARARRELDRGRPDLALELLGETDRPERPVRTGLRALAELRCGRFWRAEELLGSEPKEVFGAPGALARAELAHGKGDWTEALDAARVALTDGGLAGDAGIVSALAALELGRGELADAHLDAALPHLEGLPEVVRENLATTIRVAADLVPERRLRRGPACEPARVAFELRAGHLFVDAVLGDVECKAMLDTGQLADLSISAGLAERLGVTALGRVFSIGVAGRPVTAELVLVPELRVGGFQLLDVLATVDADVDPAYGLADYAVLGRGVFLAAGCVALDLAERTLGLAEEPALRAGSSVELPLVWGDLLVVPVELGGRELGFVLDTGAPYSVIQPELLEELEASGLRTGPKSVSRVRGTTGATLRGSLTRVEVMRLGGLELRDPVLVALDLRPAFSMLGRAYAGVLGLEALGRSRLELDLEASVLRVAAP